MRYGHSLGKVPLGGKKVNHGNRMEDLGDDYGSLGTEV